MLHPSYMELIEHIKHVNEQQGVPPINSRYSLVIAAAKRARALIDGEGPMIEDPVGGRMLSLAIAEMEEEKIGVVTREPLQEEIHAKGFDEMSVVDLSDQFEDEE